MNDEIIVNMTSKGQVLFPKAVRDKIGLVPGKPVRVGTNEQGQAVAVPAEHDDRETPEQRGKRIRAALEALAGKYRTGQSTDEYMRWLRGDYEP